MVRDLDHRRQKTDLAPEPTNFSWTKWSGLHALGGPTRRIHFQRTSPNPSSVTPSPRDTFDASNFLPCIKKSKEDCKAIDISRHGRLQNVVLLLVYALKTC
ncbi:hypothetical protein TNCV_3195811 [Trichonephila clavipes]|nr:hypothetical protein TNCV_3195811 [Trichonephila clavipes]